MPEEVIEVKDIRSAISFRSAAKKTSDEGVELPIRRSFTLNSYKWVEKYKIGGHINLLDNNTVPKLVMIERQPIKKIDWSKIFEDASAWQNIPVLSDIIKTASTGGNIVGQTAGKAYLNHLSDYYSSSISKSKELLDISDLRKIIEGPIINTYEIPFFNNSYLASANKDGWETGSSTDSLGQMGSIINDGFKTNTIKSPQWSNNSTDGMNWEVEYFLINDTLTDLSNNFTFINAIFPATQWIRMQHRDYDFGDTKAGKAGAGALNFAGQQLRKTGTLSYIKSPNVFEVECPGRFRQLFVAIDIEVEFVGNVRKMPLHNIMKGISQVNEDTLFPDAYKIRITAKDMTPPCYNVYANYLMGDEVVTTHSDDLASFGTSVKNKFNSAKQGIKNKFTR